MRFALIGPTHPHRGGIAQYTALLARELARTHDVQVVSYTRLYPSRLFPGKTQLDESAAPLAVPTERLIDSVNPLSWFAAARAVAAFRPDVAVLMWWHPFFAPALGTIARRLVARGVPVAFICHNVVPHEASVLAKGLSAWAFAPARAFLLHSAAELPALKALNARADAVVTPLPAFDHFVPARAVEPAAARAKLGITRAKVLLFFGLVRAYKGVRTLLEAFAPLAADPELELIVAGECYEPVAEYQALMDRLGLTGRVRFENRFLANEEVADYVAAADVVVLPYHSASQSGVIPVAFALDRPVIATTVGGLPEIVAHGASGLLVPPKDPAALADAIRTFFARGGRPAFADGVRAARARLGWPAMAALLPELAARARVG